ncbi:MAG: efflux RND transporter permease subunit [Arenicellales bacterium WSBS_2016_MAG_OTU3]
MNLAEYTIQNKLFGIIVILIVLVGGWNAYQNMARFEDPEFTIRTAPVVTRYPGASPLEVAQEVTEPLERALQEMEEVEALRSTSSSGLSEINVEIKYAFSKSRQDLQLIWTKLRNKVKDAEASLPPGASTPQVYDGFGDVFGLYYFITGPGYTAAELRSYAKALQSDLLQVEGVAKVTLDGAQREVIYVEIARDTAASLGASVANIYGMLEQQNAVVSAGEVTIGDRRLVIDPSGAIDSVASIKNLLVTTAADGRLIYLQDIAHVWRGYQSPPNKMFRYNGQPAIAMGVAGILGGNIVEVGNAVDAKIAEAESRRPLGMELHEYYHQGNIVDESVQAFVLNVIAALAIVIITLLIFMGLKSALIIGSILLLTIFATLLTMDLSGIPMHRISLGALIIALGMMVDNAIVVTEGILIGVQRGRKKLDIAKDIVTRTKWPLLGGTLVGIIAFAPIGFAPGSTAEFTGHLFWVILISLLFSWVFAVTLTPLFCYWLFTDSSGDSSGDTAGATRANAFLTAYKGLMREAIKARVLVVGLAVGLLAVSIWGLQFVKPGFFPASTSPQIVLDYWLPQGTDIAKTENDIKQVEAFVSELESVDAVQTVIGGGGIRYMLVYAPESGNSAYGQLLIRVKDFNLIDTLIPQIQDYVDNNFPNAQGKVWRFQLGPGGGSKVEAKFQGPDPTELRRLADAAKSVMIADGGALSIKDDWRQPVSVIEPIYSASKGRRAGVSRQDLAQALQTNFSGRKVGVYREGDDLIPIVSRAPASERVDVGDIRNIQVLSSVSGKTVPIGQVTDGFKTIWRDGVLKRENRIWSIKAQSDPLPGDLAADLQSRVRPKIDAIELPDGHTLEWGGEYGDSKESNESLASTIPLGFLAMVLTVIVLFGKLRQPIVIWLVVPFSLIGVVVGLLVMDLPFEFMAILGLLSLSGLLIKNGIVLVDQIDLEIADGTPRYDAVIEAAASRVRPVMMGALTTVLGVIPLYFDAFFQSMSVVLVFGLSFATLLTLIIVPVFYTLFFSITPEETSRA